MLAGRLAHHLAVIAAVPAIVLAVAACGSGDDGEAWEGERIQLGSVFSTSGPGVAFGPQQLRAARLAIDEINEDGGVRGAALHLRQVDDGSEPERSVAAARELIEETRALAVLGPTFSNSAAAAHPLADELGTPMLAVSNTGPGIVGDCPYPCELVFRNSLGEQDAIPANVGHLAAETGDGEALVVHPPDDPFGESTGEIAADALAAEGFAVERPAEIPAEEADLRSELRELLGDDPAVLFVTASSGELAASVIRAARGVGYEGPILGGNAFNSALAAGSAGPPGEGARSAAAWYAGNDAEANTSFAEAYRDRWGAEPDQFAAQAYSGVRLLAEAAGDAELGFTDLAADREALAAALAEVVLETPLGELRFTDDNDVSQPIWIVEMDGEGGYSLVEELPPRG